MESRIISLGETGSIIGKNIHGITDIGGRSFNEDAIGYLDIGFGEVIIVSDGMGGHSKGEFASAKSIELVFSTIKINIRDNMSENEFHSLINSSFDSANDFVTNENNKNDLDMGCTLTAFFNFSEYSYVANTGDSRTYVFSKNESGDYYVKFVTKDHSFVSQILELGLITSKEAESHPMKNVITHSIGHDYYVDITKVDLSDGDIVISMCDGVFSVVNERFILEIIKESDSYDEICRLIHDEAIKSSKDNISLIVKKY